MIEILTEREKELASKMRNYRFTHREIAKELSVCDKTVMRALKGTKKQKVSIKDVMAREHKAQAWDELRSKAGEKSLGKVMDKILTRSPRKSQEGERQNEHI